MTKLLFLFVAFLALFAYTNAQSAPATVSQSLSQTTSQTASSSGSGSVSTSVSNSLSSSVSSSFSASISTSLSSSLSGSGTPSGSLSKSLTNTLTPSQTSTSTITLSMSGTGSNSFTPSITGSFTATISSSISGSSSWSGTASFTRPPFCGNRALDVLAGEECDFGMDFTLFHCCNVDCKWRKMGKPCGIRQGECYKLPRCDNKHNCRPGLPKRTTARCTIKGTRNQGHCRAGECVPLGSKL